MPHEIVSIQRDVERARRHLAARYLQQAAGQPLRDWNPAAPDADESHVADAPGCAPRSRARCARGRGGSRPPPSPAALDSPRDARTRLGTPSGRRTDARDEWMAPLCDLAGTRLKSLRIVAPPCRVRKIGGVRGPAAAAGGSGILGPWLARSTSTPASRPITACPPPTTFWRSKRRPLPDRPGPGSRDGQAGPSDASPAVRRPFSVFEILRDAQGAVTGLSLLSKQVGAVTRDLFETEPGERIRCLGPLGTPFSIVDPPADAWMVAGGVGLAPFATLAEALHAHGVETTLFYGGRSSDDLYRVPSSSASGCGVILATEDGTRGEAGRVTAPLQRELDAAGERQVMVYACGPTPMMPRGGRADGARGPTAGGLAGAGHGLRARRLLQLRGAGPRRRHPVRPGLSRRTGSSREDGSRGPT